MWPSAPRVVLMAILLLVVNVAFAGGVLDAKLEQKMASASGPFEVIVTFQSLNKVNSLSTLGVLYHPLTTLPMAGAVLTTSQINQVLGWPTVESVYFNDQLEYFNHDAGEITGAHTVQSSLGIKGEGITILVLDSGIDATHPDLAFGSKVIENVKIVSDLGVTGTVVVTEGVINTDNTSGHGTHVSGSAGGSGAASANDERDPFYFRGVAPKVSLVGVGAGETLLILHALVAFDYAIANRDRFSIDIITNSWGNTNSNYDPNNPISTASLEAYRRGIVVTFAAGNEGPGDNTMSSYAINPWVIGVAAGDKSKNLADFSSRGEAGDSFEHPDITAPGVSIISTRAPGTPIGATGPIIDLNHPLYTLYYHTLDGTSMATPFVAGVAALLLDANSNLSPDQIEDIITSTADPMPGYPFHQVGAGYVNVLRAVQKAQTTAGNRLQFLAGDTRWSSQGDWVTAEENDSKLAYSGKWKTVSNSKASGGTYREGSAKGSNESQKPLLRGTFFGRAIKLSYPTNSSGGIGEVFIDGQSRGTISFYSSNPKWKVRSAFAGLANTNHTVDVRGVTGKVYVDQIYLDGQLFPANMIFVDETEAFTGTIGPSAAGIPETRLIPFEVSENTIQINAELSWSPAGDLDLSLLDPNGRVVASDAALNNPEVVSYWVTTPGTYNYQIAAFASVVADYTLNSIQTKAVISTNQVTAISETAASTGIPKEFALFPSYPNPFNPETTISYQLPSEGNVSLKVFDLNGREVATLYDGWQMAGRHGVRFAAKHLASGIYFYRIEVNDTAGRRFTKVNRMVLLK